ncbi:MAG: DUF4292 domain-containing protein [Tannerellaceae bacterium]|nr:DUF4292 domain-containing protein [Tannerellaceae bacterium]
MKKRILYYTKAICLFLTLIVIISGCKSTKRVGTVAAGGVKQESEFFTSLKEQALSYNTLSARLNVNLDMPNKNLSSRVDLKMIKDSIIHLSVVPLLGFEVFRIELTPENVLVIDRLNKRYVNDNYEKLRSQTPIAFNFYNLQALFTNHIFIPGEKEFSPGEYNRFTLIQEGPVAEIRIRDEMDILYAFTADGEEKVLSTRISDSSYIYHLDWNYSDFRMVEAQTFPMLMDIKVLENETSKGGIQIGFSRVQLNETLRIDSSIPSKYTKVSLDSILKSLTKNL